MIKIFIIAILVLACENPTSNSIDDDLGDNVDVDDNSGTPNIIIESYDYDINYETGFMQLSYELKNIGNGSSLDNEYRFRPCVRISYINTDMINPYNYSAIYLPSLEPGEYYSVRTDNEKVANTNGIWDTAGSCAAVY